MSKRFVPTWRKPISLFALSNQGTTPPGKPHLRWKLGRKTKIRPRKHKGRQNAATRSARNVIPRSFHLPYEHGNGGAVLPRLTCPQRSARRRHTAPCPENESRPGPGGAPPAPYITVTAAPGPAFQPPDTRGGAPPPRPVTAAPPAPSLAHLRGVRRVEEAQLAERLVRRRAGVVGQRRAGLVATQAAAARRRMRRGAPGGAAALVGRRRRGRAGREVGAGRLDGRGAEALLLPRVPLVRQRRGRGLHHLLLLLQQGRAAPRRGAGHRERRVRLLEGRVLAGAVAAAAALLLLLVFVLLLAVTVAAEEQQLLPDRGGRPPGRDPPRRRRRLQAEEAHGGSAARRAPLTAAPSCALRLSSRSAPPWARYRLLRAALPPGTAHLALFGLRGFPATVSHVARTPANRSRPLRLKTRRAGTQLHALASRNALARTGRAEGAGPGRARASTGRLGGGGAATRHGPRGGRTDTSELCGPAPS